MAVMMKRCSVMFADCVAVLAGVDAAAVLADVLVLSVVCCCCCTG